MEFKFKSTKEPFIIKGSNDEVLKSYIVDTGNEAFVRAITEKIDKLQKIDTNSIDEIKAVQKEIIDSVFNNEFDELYVLFEENIFAMMELIVELANMMKKNTNDKFKKYLS